MLRLRRRVPQATTRFSTSWRLRHWLCRSRSSLQGLKHADSCTVRERAELVRQLRAVEGSMVLVLRFAWLGVEESQAPSAARSALG